MFVSETPPYINTEFVAQALREMGRAAPQKPHNPLMQLLLVDEVLRERAMPHSSEAHTFALYDVITRLIEDGLRNRRDVYGLPMPESGWQMEDITQSIRQDIAPANADLMAYSLLYHCYVRVDWSITPTQYAECIAVTERTLRRYQNYGFRRLTHALIAREREARRAARQHWLEQAAPNVPPRRLIGRDDLLNTLVPLSSTPTSLLMSGVSGIGKTALALALVRRWIAADAVSDLVWLTEPPTTAYIRATLMQKLVPDGVSTTLNSVLSLTPKPVLIVLDRCEALLQHDAAGVDALLSEGGTALWLLTSQYYRPLRSLTHHIAVLPLSPDESLSLMSQYSMMGGDSLFIEQATSMIEQIGGIPEILLLTAQQFDIQSWEQISVTATAHLYGHVFQRLKQGERLAWCALALQPSDSHETDATSSAVWGDLLITGAAPVLRQWSVMGREMLENGARRFIELHAALDPEIQSYLDALLLHLDHRVERSPETVIPLIQQLLMSEWLRLDDRRRIHWITHGAAAGIRSAMISTWAILLESLTEDQRGAELSILYSVCLRRLGDWDRADLLLDRVIAQLGARGEFGLQADALVEASVIARYQGRYQDAQERLARAETSATRYAPMLMGRIASEQARIALDRGLPDQAFRWLAGQSETADSQILKCEAYLLLNMQPECRTLADQLLERRDLLMLQRSAVHTLLGRSFEQDGDYVSAHWHFANSAALAESSGDALALARAHGNIGAVMLHLAQNDRAQSALIAAERELTHLGDWVGAAAVRHNRQIADMRLARGSVIL